jgi:hypothetical protein
VSPRRPARDRERYAPVFILCTARSCSSVITTMLGRNPDLFGLPELKLFAYETIGELDASLPSGLRRRGTAHRSPGLVRAIAELIFGEQSPHAAGDALAWLTERSDWTGAEVLDLVQACAAPRAIVEKSPESAVVPDALERLADAYPRARYLHLTRHPNSTARSLAAHWARTMPSAALEDAELEGLTWWLVVNERIGRSGAALPADRFLLVRAEDALNDPDGRLRRIARWLGVRDDDDAVAAMRHPEDSPFAGFGPAGVEGGHDHGFLRSPAPRATLLPAAVLPRAHGALDPELWAGIVALSAELGYGDTRVLDSLDVLSS